MRSPLIHFSLLGLLIFSVQVLQTNESAQLDSANTQVTSPILIDAEKQLELNTSFQRQTGRFPNTRERDRLIDGEIEEEILFRQALELGFLEQDGGVQTRLIQKMLFLESDSNLEDAEILLDRAIALDLHRDDIVVRRILVQKARLQASRLRPEEQPSSEEIEQIYRERKERLRSPDRRDLAHVFLSSDRRQSDTKKDALALRKHVLSSDRTPDEAIDLGDPFPLGHSLVARSKLDLRRTFGADFGAQVFDTRLKTWSQPIESAYGQHLVWTSRVIAGVIPPFEEVGDHIRSEIERERQQRKLEAFLLQQRSQVSIVIETTEVPE